MRLYMPASLRAMATQAGGFVEEAEAHAAKWIRQHRLVADDRSASLLAAMRPGALAAHCFPRASAPQMCLLADWMSWLFVVDDGNDEWSPGRCPEEFEQRLATVHAAAFGYGPASGPDALAGTLQDIWDRVCPAMDQAWQRRFTRHVANYFSANVWQAAHRALGQAPATDTFAQMRRDAGAIWPSFDLIEWVAGLSLPPPVYFSATYQALLTTAADVVCWTNDIMTIDKEIAYGDVHNLVLVLRHHRGGGLQSAIDEVVRRTERRMRTFLAAERDLPAVLSQLQLPADDQARVLDCVAMLRAWMRGHVDWGVQTERYWCGAEIWAMPHHASAAAHTP